MNMCVMDVVNVQHLGQLNMVMGRNKLCFKSDQYTNVKITSDPNSGGVFFLSKQLHVDPV